MIGFSIPFFSGCQSKSFDKMLDKWLDENQPAWTVEQLLAAQESQQIAILDSRKKEEFEVSHIKGSRWVGYGDFKLERIQDIPKTSTVVVYCSIGYRSEKVCKKLRRAGYRKVFNLRGSIFDWHNKGNPVYNKEEIRTNEIHTFNKNWGKWVTHGVKVH